jgi:hypothetical protein
MKRNLISYVMLLGGMFLACRALIAVSVTGEEQAEARRWAAAKFEGVTQSMDGCGPYLFVDFFPVPKPLIDAYLPIRPRSYGTINPFECYATANFRVWDFGRARDCNSNGWGGIRQVSGTH